MEACYHLPLRSPQAVSDTMFKSCVIKKDENKIKIDIQDKRDIIRTESSTHCCHGFVDVGDVKDSWISDVYKLSSNINLKDKLIVESGANQVDTFSAIKCEDDEDIFSEMKNGEKLVVTNGEPCSNVVDTEHSYTLTQPVKFEANSNEIFTFESDENGCVHRKHDSIESKSISISDESSDRNVKTGEPCIFDLSPDMCLPYPGQSSVNFNSCTDVQTSDNTSYDRSESSLTSSDFLRNQDVDFSGRVETLPSRNGESDGANSEPNRRRCINRYCVKVQCPECHKWYYYTRKGIIRHIKADHIRIKKELVYQFQEDCSFENLHDDRFRVCELCGVDIPQVYMPLHVQWTHGEEHHEESQRILENYYQVMDSKKRIATKTLNYEFNVRFKKIGTVETVFCKSCQQNISSENFGKHHSRCNSVKRKYYVCGCNFKTLIEEKLEEHRKHCNHMETDSIEMGKKSMKAYLVKTQCPYCRTWTKYHRTGIFKHLTEFHTKLEKKHNIIAKFKEEILDYNMTSDEKEKVECDICKCMINKDCFILHIATRHIERTYEKSQFLLDKEYALEKAVDENLELKTPIHGFDLRLEKQKKLLFTESCEFCQTHFNTKKMATHIKNCKLNPDRRRYFYCSCGFKSADQQKLDFHKQQCKEVGRSLEANICCEYCGKNCKSKSDYYQHRKYQHRIFTKKTTSIIEFACEKCPRVFHLKSRLKNHVIAQHTDQQNFVCELCGRGFKFEHDLKRHINFAHKNKYRYYCKKCGHGINKKESLEKHVCGKTRKRKKLHEVLIARAEQDCEKATYQQTAPSTENLCQITTQNPRDFSQNKKLILQTGSCSENSCRIATQGLRDLPKNKTLILQTDICSENACRIATQGPREFQQNLFTNYETDAVHFQLRNTCLAFDGHHDHQYTMLQESAAVGNSNLDVKNSNMVTRLGEAFIPDTTLPAHCQSTDTKL